MCSGLRRHCLPVWQPLVQPLRLHTFAAWALSFAGLKVPEGDHYSNAIMPEPQRSSQNDAKASDRNEADEKAPKDGGDEENAVYDLRSIKETC